MLPFSGHGASPKTRPTHISYQFARNYQQKKELFLRRNGGSSVKNGMDTPNQNEKTEAPQCCARACERHRCCKLALGLVNTMLMATLTAAVAVLCIKHCDKHHH